MRRPPTIEDEGEFELEPVTPMTLARGELDELVQTRMPFGRFKGSRLIDLPEPYVVWFRGQGFPEGKLGKQLAVLYEIKRYGLEAMLRPLVRENRDDR